jgi:mono/diheme cytochrome c family protein
MNKIDKKLVQQLLAAKDHRARAAAVRVLRYSGHQVPEQAKWLLQAANDPHGRVRLEAIVAASWLDQKNGLPVLSVASKHPLDEWIAPAYETSLAHLNGREVKGKFEEFTAANLKGGDARLFVKGREIYSREGFCGTCHQPDGKGLPASGFPPLHNTNWVEGNQDRLIKLVLKGLHGPIEVQGKTYPGQVPMTPFEGMLNDEEVAAVLTYVRNSFGNNSSAVSPARVKEIRAATKNKTGFYSPQELLKQHPLEK